MMCSTWCASSWKSTFSIPSNPWNSSWMLSKIDSKPFFMSSTTGKLNIFSGLMLWANTLSKSNLLCWFELLTIGWETGCCDLIAELVRDFCELDSEFLFCSMKALRFWHWSLYCSSSSVNRFRSLSSSVIFCFRDGYSSFISVIFLKSHLKPNESRFSLPWYFLR